MLNNKKHDIDVASKCTILYNIFALLADRDDCIGRKVMWTCVSCQGLRLQAICHQQQLSRRACRFVELITDAGGIHLLLSLPRNQNTYGGLSLALFGLASLPLAFERICALPAPVPSQLVSLSLALLGSGFDQARKNSASFFSLTMHFKVVLGEFDAQEGLKRLLSTLRNLVALQRSGNISDARNEKPVSLFLNIFP